MADFVEFKCDLDSFVDDLKSIVEKNKNKIDDLLKIKDKTYKNFVCPFKLVDENLELFFTPLSHLNAVENSDITQSVYAESLPVLTEYTTEVSQNIEIYNIYKDIKNKEYDSLDFEAKKVLDDDIQGFELSGAHLDDKTKTRLQEINLRKSELTNNFSQNLLDATNEFSLVLDDKKDVDGVPRSDLANAQFEEDGKTKWKFTLQMPSYIAYMTYGPSRSVREKIYKAYVTRAPQNSKIIDELLKLKKEMSRLLGFDNFAQLSLATKMAPDTTHVLEFLDSLALKSQKQADEEIKTLKQMANGELESYDTAFYAQKLKKRDFDLDEELYRPYFEKKSVVNGMFEFLSKLFSLEFRQTDEKLYSEKAISYDILEDGVVKARLYFDLEARESKRGGAWMHNYQTHYSDCEGDEHLASAFVVCNFPSSSDENPSLLRHDDVVTLFHEMGHALHHTLSDVKTNALSGVNGVEWDAVEFPSQFLENFAYEKDVLKLFAKHYKSGEVLSDEMIEKLDKTKNFMSATGMLRQLEFATFDFKLYMGEYEGDEVQKLLDEVREKTSLLKPPSYNKFQNGFAHIFSGGYSAGYYSYKYAEVLSADVFMRVVKEGVFNSATALKYKDIILKGGSSKGMYELYKELMDAEPNTDALLELSGIFS